MQSAAVDQSTEILTNGRYGHLVVYMTNGNLRRRRIAMEVGLLRCLCMLLLISGCSRPQTFRCYGQIITSDLNHEIGKNDAVLAFRVRREWPIFRPFVSSNLKGLVDVNSTSQNSYGLADGGILDITSDDDDTLNATNVDRDTPKVLLFDKLTATVRYDQSINDANRSFSGRCANAHT